MSEILPIQNINILTDLPEAINRETDPILNAQPVEEAKNFIIKGVTYTADLNRITRRLKKEAQKIAYTGVNFTQKGESTGDSTSTLMNNLEIVSDLLAKAIFTIPDDVDLDDLPVTQIDPLLEYVNNLDILGFIKAGAAMRQA